MKPNQNHRQHTASQPVQSSDQDEDCGKSLPDGFCSMDSAPKDRSVRLLTESGHAVIGKIKHSRHYDNVKRRWVARSLWSDPATGRALRFNPLGWGEV